MGREDHEREAREGQRERRRAAPPEGAMGALLTLREHLGDLTKLLQDTHAAMALQCAVTTIAYFNPALRHLPGLEALHKENYEVAYHLTTAIGSAHMIQMGAQQPEFVAIVLDCLHEAREHEERAVAHFQEMSRHAEARVRPLVEQMQGRLQAVVGLIERTQGVLNRLLGAETVRRLRAWSEAQGG